MGIARLHPSYEDSVCVGWVEAFSADTHRVRQSAPFTKKVDSVAECHCGEKLKSQVRCESNRWVSQGSTHPTGFGPCRVGGGVLPIPTVFLPPRDLDLNLGVAPAERGIFHDAGVELNSDLNRDVR
jgi:hypothetical protein